MMQANLRHFINPYIIGIHDHSSNVMDIALYIEGWGLNHEFLTYSAYKS